MGDTVGRDTFIFVAIGMLIVTIGFSGVVYYDSESQERDKIVKGFLNKDQQAIKEVLEGGKLPKTETLKFLEMYIEQFGE